MLGPLLLYGKSRFARVKVETLYTEYIEFYLDAGARVRVWDMVTPKSAGAIPWPPPSVAGPASDSEHEALPGNTSAAVLGPAD